MTHADTASPEKTKELTLIERAAVALGAPKYEVELAALVANTASIVVVKNAAGREQCHAAYMRLKNARVAIEKAGKAARDDATKFSKAVIEEQQRLVAISEPEEQRLAFLRDDWDEARAAERAELARLEAERQALVQEHIDDLKQIPLHMIGKTAMQIKIEIADLETVLVDVERFGKRVDEALRVKADVLEKLVRLHNGALVAEAAAARAAEQAEADRIERERVAAEQRAEAERLAALAAEIEQREAAARAEQEAADRRAAAARAEEDRKAQAVRDLADRLAREERAAAQHRIDVQEAEIREQRRAAEDAARGARERAEAEERAARAAKQRRIDDEAAAARRAQQEADDARRAAEEAAHAAEQKVRDAAPAMLEALFLVRVSSEWVCMEAETQNAVLHAIDQATL